MKKLLFFAAFAVFGLTMSAQEKTTKSDVKKVTSAVENEAVKQYNKAKTGGFKVGANIGLPMQEAGDIASFNMGADIAWLWEVAPNWEVGGLTGFTQIFGDGTYKYINDPYDFESKLAAKSTDGIVVDYSNESFIPIAATGRWYFSDRKMYVGADLGYAIHVAGDADGGFYFRPKFGWNFGKVNLVGSFQRISGGVHHLNTVDAYSVSGFNSANIGVEFAF